MNKILPFDNIPLSLYIHIPWCIRKCPYCDFNSHPLTTPLPEANYIKALLRDLDEDLSKYPQNRPLQTIFIGGGTPSLLSAAAMTDLLDGIATRLNFANDIEITLEANPGTAEQQRFRDYRKAGINRLSLGIQSLQDDKLSTLGRIHDHQQALRAIETTIDAGFSNFNCDLMYGLPQQTPEDALFDLQKVLDYQPPHLSWYQLTIEPNTVFYKKTPTLPDEMTVDAIEQQGRNLLNTAGLTQYEISAYAQKKRQSQHNINYWKFGDYLGIGAGAHSKLSLPKGHIMRLQKIRQPQLYLNHSPNFTAQTTQIETSDITFEFMLNALRLYEPIPWQVFYERTGLEKEILTQSIQQAVQRELMEYDEKTFQLTTLGRRFYNDVVGMFLKSGVIPA